MANNPYVIGSQDVSIYFKTPEMPAGVKLETATALNYTFTQNLQEIFAIGANDPIDLKELNATYTASLTFQSGEYQTLVDIVNGALPASVPPYATLNQLRNFTISKVTTMTNAAIPKTVTEVLYNCQIDNNSSDVNRNEAETLHTISLRGTGVQRIVLPIG